MNRGLILPAAGFILILNFVAPALARDPKLEAWPVPVSAVDSEVPDPAVAAASEAIFAAEGPTPRGGLGGSLSHTTRQPTGALSGVVIFTSGGHGWTAGATDWILQRPVTLNMNEDHGNLDQLNAFVYYAFNAGATVVPFRPVGQQSIEVVLDNDDLGVTYNGAWSDGTTAKYYENGATNSGVFYKTAPASPTETQTARFTPDLPQTDFYPVFGFALAGTNRVPQTYRIHHTGGTTEIVVDHRAVGNGWIFLGIYHFLAGQDGYVEVSNQSSVAGVVVIDAIRFGGGMGDIVRPGPGTTSGFARDEECSRYWAHGELGNNAVGFSSSIWDGGGDDQSDNVGTAARWSAEMNQVPAGGVQVDRWKRVYVEFHTNAFDGQSRGSVGLYNNVNTTTNQVSLAAIMSDEVDNDMFALDDISGAFEFPWGSYSLNTLGSDYGAISTANNGNEFDATIIEVAFHDNAQDAALLRDQRIREALGRTSVQGIIRFLNSLPNSQVPLAFPPVAPDNFRVEDIGGGDVKLSWAAPISGPAYGDAATGYVVYASTNGYGFAPVATLGNVLTTTISGVPTLTTRYYRVAATNTGGESTPTETLAVRRPASGIADTLIVDGFDRLRRTQNPLQDLGIGVIERQIPRKTNSYDYIVQFADALAATTIGFASCSNEAVIASQITLTNYRLVLWELGNESIEEDHALNATEYARLQTFLNSGGGLFISGSDLALDLAAQAGGAATFMQDALHCGLGSDDAGTYAVEANVGGIFEGIAPFDFDPSFGAAYPVYAPDTLTVRSGAFAALNYNPSGVAAVQYDSGVFRTVTFGFPFEAISSADARAEVMAHVLDYLQGVTGPLLFDFDFDHDVDQSNYNQWSFCLGVTGPGGPGKVFAPGHACLSRDGDGDKDVDLYDFMIFQQVYTGPHP
jgi:hypothetical protein